MTRADRCENVPRVQDKYTYERHLNVSVYGGDFFSSSICVRIVSLASDLGRMMDGVSDRYTV